MVVLSSDTRAVVFDLDDTLYSERAYVFSGYRAVADAFADRLNAPFDPAERMRALFDSPDRARVFNAILAECGFDDDPDLVRDMIDVYRNHRPTISLFADAEDALSRLSSVYRIGIITDGYAVTQHAKIDALNLRNRVDEIIVTDDWGRKFWKPHARAFEEMARRLSVPHEACLYAADNPAKDFVAPNALGWRTVFVNRPGGVHVRNPAAPGGAAGTTITSLDALL